MVGGCYQVCSYATLHQSQRVESQFTGLVAMCRVVAAGDLSLLEKRQLNGLENFGANARCLQVELWANTGNLAHPTGGKIFIGHVLELLACMLKAVLQCLEHSVGE
ncbi:hypothetical protein D3C81_1707550 [compost metagenome]